MSEADLVRAEYESSASWRLTRPLRTLKRQVAGSRLAPASAAPAPNSSFDSWLEHFHGPQLAAIDAACASGGPQRFALFRGLDPDAWGMLLTQDQERYPHIAALLPQVPAPDLQELWNGASGTRLAIQSKAFYTTVLERFAEHGGGTPLSEARVLDYGCGWGRLLRWFARDVAPGNLHGCDPVQSILDVCRDTGVPGELVRTPFLPERLPYAEPFDLAWSFSVFTHLSESAADMCLRALHAALRPGGILVVTVRPPDYLHLEATLRAAFAPPRTDLAGLTAQPRFFFVPHAAEPSHPQYQGGEMTYGEAVVTMPYIRERWGELFEVLAADVALEDLHQVAITLRRR